MGKSAMKKPARGVRALKKPGHALKRPAAAVVTRSQYGSLPAEDMRKIKTEIASTGCSLAGVVNTDDKTGFVYTTGFTGIGRPELLARCSKSLLQHAGSTLSFLMKRTRDGHLVEGDQNVVSHSLAWRTRRLKGSELAKVNKECMCRSRAFYQKEVGVIELALPQEMGDKLVKGEKGGHDADTFRWHVRKTILAGAQQPFAPGFGFFIRHVDGNTLNCVSGNLSRVHIAEALRHLDWQVDWVLYLSHKEVTAVRKYLAKVPNAWQAFKRS